MTSAHQYAVLGWFLLLCASATGQDLLPRPALDPGPPVIVPAPATLGSDPPRRLVVKFVDAVQARCTERGQLISKVGADLSEPNLHAAASGLAFSPLLRVPEDKLAGLQARGEANSGIAQPDLAGLLVVTPPGNDEAALLASAHQLAALPQVEFVTIQTLGLPPPGDIAPPTPDFTGQQHYVGPDPGLDVVFARSLGLLGQGIRVADVEYGWNVAHEDLVDVDTHPEPGQTVHPQVFANDWDDHGASVVGLLAAPDNGYGITGLCPQATIATYTEWSLEEGYRRETAVAHALADSAFGDIVLLEMQTLGAGGGLGPAELDPVIWLLVKAGTDAGVVVVAAAGNGAQDLDGLVYSPYALLGDSGAILVGAGTPDSDHATLFFSTFGSRVDVQAWGASVFTLGWVAALPPSNIVIGGDENQRYTSGFLGTSSASALVTAAACLVQQRALQVNGQRLGPLAMRQLLVDTGRPQGAGGPIGPHPDLHAALQALGPLPATWVDLGGGSMAGHQPALQMGGALTPLSPVFLLLTGAPPSSPMLLWISLSSAPMPLLGGTLHAFPFQQEVFAFTQANGSLFGQSAWPPGIPPGTSTWWQVLVQDVTSPWGLSLSNGVVGTTP